MAAKLISPKEAKVLELLIAQGDLYGLALVKHSEGELKLGTIYVLLGRMEDKGYLESRLEAEPTMPGLPRRFYRAKGLGEKALALWQQVQSLHASAVLG